MLLLLESRPLLGEEAYTRLLQQVVDRYWKYDKDHGEDHLPIFLTNDIVRYWRILLLNYESKNTQKSQEPLSEEQKEADRRLRSYKLRFSRCLTCYSALAYLLALVKAHGKVSDSQVLEMVKLTPLDRLEKIDELSQDAGIRDELDRMRGLYQQFLTVTTNPKKSLRPLFEEPTFRQHRAKEGREFGDSVFRMLGKLGDGNPLYRFIVV